MFEYHCRLNLLDRVLELNIEGNISMVIIALSIVTPNRFTKLFWDILKTALDGLGNMGIYEKGISIEV